VKINPTDLRIDVFRSSGPGGQSVNTTDSAVRITHIPSGMVVSMQDEKSQIKNRAKAMKVLLSRLQDFYLSQDKEKESQNRKSQIGSGDRSEKIRTYNFPQGRMTDHRINLSLFNLQELMNGDLDELADNLRKRSRDLQLTGAK
jgi:peptide chain release factor 1